MISGGQFENNVVHKPQRVFENERGNFIFTNSPVNQVQGLAGRPLSANVITSVHSFSETAAMQHNNSVSLLRNEQVAMQRMNMQSQKSNRRLPNGVDDVMNRQNDSFGDYGN